MNGIFYNWDINGTTGSASQIVGNVQYFNNTTVENGGVFNLDRQTFAGSNGTGSADAINTTVTTNGQLNVFANTKVDKTTVSDGGVLNVNGVATHTIINNEGLEMVQGAQGVQKQGPTIAHADITSINNNGEQDVGLFGVATQTDVHKGGLQHVFANGEADGTMIRTGGGAVVEANGIIMDATIDGGTLVLKDGAIAALQIAFGDNVGNLVINQSMNGHMDFQPTLKNFVVGDTIDISNLQFKGANVSFDHGLLTVANGDVSETFHVDGGSATQFHTANDGNGGTLLIAGAAPAHDAAINLVGTLGVDGHAALMHHLG